MPGLGVRMSGSFHHDGSLLFEGLAMELAAEKWTCLLGPSGVGKSTVLRLLAGLSTGGEFTGEIVADDGLGVAHRISYMAQSDLLFPWLNVRQNVMLGQRLRGDGSTARSADELIQQVGLGAHISKRPAQLSGGMRQRVALARTLMEDTPLVLLDEPFSALDARTRSEMQDLAFRVLEGKTVLFVTHDPAQAVRLSHHLYLMSESGLTEHTLELAAPIRKVSDTMVLSAQSELLVSLKRGFES
jgi:putative hydroxymethylpyrimidine transport system ATP-binding protein